MPSSDSLSAVELRLRDQPLRLLPLHDVPQLDDRPRRIAPLFDGRREDDPAVLVRIGRDDLDDACAAIGTAINPIALVIALSDHAGVIVSAGRAARRADLALLTDPVFFRCAMRNGRISQNLARLPYAPTAEHGPWTAVDLHPSAARQLVREVFAAQDGRQSGGWVAPTVALTADPGTLGVARCLLAVSLETRSAFGREPLVAPLVIDMAHHTGLDSQRRLVRALEGLAPEAFLVSLGGAETSPQRLAESMRLLVLLRAGGVRALLAKAGPLRAFALALGIGGFETGLGRLERFALDDFRGSGGPGSHPAKYEIVQLLTALTPWLAAQVLRSGLLDDDGCDCAICTAGWTAGNTQGTVLHDATVIARDVRAAIGRDTTTRIANLGRRISSARSIADDLHDAGVDVRRQTAHLARWAETIELIKRWGLDEPGAADRLLAA